MFLVKHHVPYDVAFSLGPAEKLAHIIAIGELEGSTFSFETMSFSRN
jgi:hypothetical protein